MAEKSFPYGSANHDRRYKSSDFRAYYAQMIGNGVYYSNANALKVREGEGMTILLGVGGAFIEGVGYRNTSDRAFRLDTADGALSRIDRIVIRNDYQKRDTYAAVLKGEYSAHPQAAALTRNADMYEIAVADVLVAKGVISITQADITDTRLNSDLCGIVTGLIQQADTTDIFNQFTAFLTEFKQEHVSEFGAWTEEQKQGFITWENGIRNILNENVAGNLLAMIGELQGLETAEKGNLVGALNEVFMLGNEKKRKLTENLIAMGMEASVSDTWEQLLDKVLEMTDTSGDTVTAATLLAGYTAHNAAGEQITGVIPQRAGVTVDATATTQDDAYTYFNMPPGHYDANSKVRSANSNLTGNYKVFTVSNGTDMKKLLPNDYHKLTTNNFFVLPPENSSNGGRVGSVEGTQSNPYLSVNFNRGTFSYNASTGIFSITNGSAQANYDNGCRTMNTSIIYNKVICIYPSI